MNHLKDARLAPLQAQLLSLSKERELPAVLEAPLSEMLKLSSSSGGALQRDHYEPGHFTASAFLLSPARDALFLISHKKLSLWLQPGGHVESTDANLIDAALREVQEETGISDVEVLEPLFDLDVHSIPAHGKTPEHLHFDVRVLLQSRTLEFGRSDEVADGAWFPLEEIAESREVLRDGLRTDESVRRVAKRLMSLR